MANFTALVIGDAPYIEAYIEALQTVLKVIMMHLRACIRPESVDDRQHQVYYLEQ